MPPMPAAVRALYDPLPDHVRAALAEAQQRNPAAAQLFTWAVELGRWVLGRGAQGRRAGGAGGAGGAGTLADLTQAQQHPAWPRVEDDLAAVTLHLARDPAVARLLSRQHVATLVYGRFLHRVAGADVAREWLRTRAVPLRVTRLWPEQRVRLRYEDGEPALVAPAGTQAEVKRLWPVLEWHRRLAGLPPQRRGRRADAVPRDELLRRLLEALEQLRAGHPDYTAGQKLPLTAIADQAGYSRQYLSEQLKAHGVDAARLRWWRPGQPIPLVAPRRGERRGGRIRATQGDSAVAQDGKERERWTPGHPGA